MSASHGADQTDLMNCLAHEVADEGEYGCIVSKPDSMGTISLWALPAKGMTQKNKHLIPFIEIHSRLCAWWLTVAWRSTELARSTWSLGDRYEVIATAACARALLETAAALWCDARK